MQVYQIMQNWLCNGSIGENDCSIISNVASSIQEQCNCVFQSRTVQLCLPSKKIATTIFRTRIVSHLCSSLWTLHSLRWQSLLQYLQKTWFNLTIPAQRKSIPADRKCHYVDKNKLNYLATLHSVHVFSSSPSEVSWGVCVWSILIYCDWVSLPPQIKELWSWV